MKQIICLATSPWYPIPTRKQQVMSRLTDFQVLYFDPPITYLGPLKDRALLPKLTHWRTDRDQPKPNVTVFSLPPLLPLFNKFRWINRLNQKRIARYVNHVSKAHGFTNPLLWVYSPTTVDCVDKIHHSALVYDCVDRHSAYGGLMNPAVVDAMELSLAAKADAVFVTAKNLAQRLLTANKSVHFIPNGANFERFFEASKPQPRPDDLPSGDAPIFVFVGALQSCNEYGYVAYAAKVQPDWRFVFLGRQVAGVDLSLLQALPNCHFLGLRPNEQLPQYLAHCDVCLNLFDQSDLSRDVSPLKFFEYLATGKPIVSTSQPEQILQYAADIHIAASPEDFLQKCRDALADTDPARAARRIELGRACSWDHRVAQMRQLLAERHII